MEQTFSAFLPFWPVSPCFHPFAPPLINENSSSLLTEIKEYGEIQIESNSHIGSPHHVKPWGTNNKINTLSFSLDSRRSSKEKKSHTHRKQHLSSWEDRPASYCLTYFYDSFGIKRSKTKYWLYKKSDESTLKKKVPHETFLGFVAVTNLKRLSCGIFFFSESSHQFALLVHFVHFDPKNKVYGCIVYRKTQCTVTLYFQFSLETLLISFIDVHC